MIRTPATLRRWALRLPIVLALLTAIAHGQGFLDEARKFFRVAVSPGSPTAAAGGTLDVVLAFDVDHGIHVYSDAERLNATWDETTGAEFVSLVVPPAKAIPDILNEGQTVDVLEEKFELRARFRVTATDGGMPSMLSAAGLSSCSRN
ncbi:hypothetical protein HQ576_04800 [bacterium]|nr:hypothetical protein [bacterium]